MTWLDCSISISLTVAVCDRRDFANCSLSATSTFEIAWLIIKIANAVVSDTAEIRDRCAPDLIQEARELAGRIVSVSRGHAIVQVLRLKPVVIQIRPARRLAEGIRNTSLMTTCVIPNISMKNEVPPEIHINSFPIIGNGLYCFAWGPVISPLTAGISSKTGFSIVDSNGSQKANEAQARIIVLNLAFRRMPGRACRV